MKRYRMIAALGAFLGLLLLKTAFPGLAAELREKLHWKQEMPQAVTAFKELGKRLSLRETVGETPAPAEAPAPPPVPARTAFVSYRVEEGTAGGEPEPTETPVPEAVSAFLERQAAFGDCELPENVDPSFVALPFDYASPVMGYESSGFGFRLHPILNTVRFHFGTDFAANAGEPVTAFADGVVVFCHWGCKETAGASQLIAHRLEAAGYPVLILDGDGCDRANCMEGQMSTRFTAFLEMLRARREEAVHADAR